MLRATLCNIAVMLVTAVACKTSAAEPQWDALVVPAAAALLFAYVVGE